MSSADADTSETTSKKRQGYFHSLTYTTLFHAHKPPTTDSPSSSIGSKFRRQFNPFKGTVAEAGDEVGKSTSHGESSPLCGGSDEAVVILDVDSTEGQRSKRTKGNECLGGLKAILEGKTHPVHLPGTDCSADFAQDKQQPDSCSQLGFHNVYGLEDNVTCTAVSCLPSFRLGQRTFGRDVSNHGGGGAKPKAERVPDINKGGDLTASNLGVKVDAEGGQNAFDAEGNDIRDTREFSSSPSDAHMTAAPLGDFVNTELLSSQRSDLPLPPPNAIPMHEAPTDSKSHVGDPLQTLADAQAKLVAQLESRLRQLEEACAVQEQRAAATNERKMQAEEAVRRALAALHRAQESLHSLELAALRASSRARDCHVAANEAQQHLQHVLAAQQREREELEGRLRAQRGGKAAAVERLRELAATLASVDFSSADAATVRHVEAALSQLLLLQWAQRSAAEN